MEQINPPFLVSIETNYDYFKNAKQIVKYFGPMKIKSIWMPEPNENKIFVEFCTATDYKHAFALISRKSKNEPQLQLCIKKADNYTELLPKHVKQQQQSRPNDLSWRTSYDSRKSRSVSNLRDIGTTRKRTESLNDDLSIHKINQLSLQQPTSKFLKNKIETTQALERPKLNLLPRSKPLNSDSEIEKRSSIFGNAKPVDTFSRELEIEERLEREKADARIKWRSSSSLNVNTNRREKNVCSSISSQTEINLASKTPTELQNDNNSNRVANTSKALVFKQDIEDLTIDSNAGNQLASQERKEAYDLYQCLMENVGDAVSDQDFYLHHEASRTLVLENFIEQTEKQGVKINKQDLEALKAEIEENYESLKNQGSHDTEKHQLAELPSEMIQAITNVTLAYENNMMEQMSVLKNLKDKHAVFFAEALDLYDLLTEFMLANKSAAYQKLLSELNHAYERIQEQQQSIFFEKSRHQIEVWFMENLNNLNLDFKQCSKLKYTALTKFDETMIEFPNCKSDMIINQRQNLKSFLNRELENFAVCVAVSQRSEAVQEYRNAMSAACESGACEKGLEQANVVASQAARDNYTLKTAGLLQNVVIEQQNVLTKDLAGEYENFKMVMIEQKILKRQENETQELSRAFTSGLEFYMSMTEQPEDCQGDVLRELEARHVTAQETAVNTFNLMTENLAPAVTVHSRDKLITELNKRYVKYNKFLTENILKLQVKIAQAAFSERMQKAAQVDDMFTRLQDQAQIETLVNFDLATVEFDRDIVAEYRAKLEESFEFCLEVVQKLRSSSDFPAGGDTGLCCVCTENRATVVFQPCLHFNTCDTCAANFTTCAMCRAPIQNKLHVYQ